MADDNSEKDNTSPQNSSPSDGPPSDSPSPPSSFRHRIASFTWANFTCTQSTGGIAILLAETPHQFHGLQAAGAAVFILNLVLLVLLSALMVARFALHGPRALRRSLTNPPEAFFAGSFLLSLATVIIGMDKFARGHVAGGEGGGGDWLGDAVRVLFWFYAAVTLIYNIAVFVIMFSRAPLQAERMNPGMFLTVFNTMLTGTVAGTIAMNQQDPAQRMPIIVAGVAYQGLGWVLSLLLLPRFVGSMLVGGLGPPDLRPGLFMPVGSAGYTIVSLMGCAEAIPVGYGYFAKHPTAPEVLQIVALWTSIFLWLFTFWLSAIALIANVATVFPRRDEDGKVSLRNRTSFTLPWWAIIFPNVGFTLATVYIGKALESEAINWVATVMTILLVGAWLMDLSLHIVSMLRGRFM